MTTKKTTRKTAPKAKSTTAKKTAATAKPTRKAKLAAEPKAGMPMTISHEERWRMIAVAAYHKAERRAFQPGYEVNDWLEAEQEISAVLSGQ